MTDPPPRHSTDEDIVAWLNRATSDHQIRVRARILAREHGATWQMDDVSAYPDITLASGKTTSYDEASGTWTLTDPTPPDDTHHATEHEGIPLLATFVQIVDRTHPGHLDMAIEMVAANLERFTASDWTPATARPRMLPMPPGDRVALVALAVLCLKCGGVSALEVWEHCLERGYPHAGTLLTLIGSNRTVHPRITCLANRAISTLDTDDFVGIASITAGACAAMGLAADDLRGLKDRPTGDINWDFVDHNAGLFTPFGV